MLSGTHFVLDLVNEDFVVCIIYLCRVVYLDCTSGTYMCSSILASVPHGKCDRSLYS